MFQMVAYGYVTFLTKDYPPLPNVTLITMYLIIAVVSDIL